MSESANGSRPGKAPRTFRTWVWIGLGLIIGAVAGLAAGNLAAGFGVGAALGITFAYALDRSGHR